MTSEVTRSDSAPTRVIYIAGWGRSGSTLLGNLLGLVPGCFSGGELRFFIQRGIVEDRICGDGVRFSQHPLWQGVLERLERELDFESEAMRKLEQQLLGGSWPLADYWTGWHRGRGKAAEKYVAYLDSLYNAIHDATNSDVIIDTSKYPVYAAWLGRVPGIELTVIHLVRDPRAVAWSWLRKKQQPDLGSGRIAERHPFIKSALQWNLINRAADGLANGSSHHYRLMRYDDMVREPAEALRSVLDTAEMHDRDIPDINGSEIEMGASQAFSGNPDRFKSGPIRLKIDDEWRDNMPGWQRGIVSSINGSLIRRYGYEQ